MTAVRRLSAALAVTATATAGVYTLVYLARWEWHRAIITALFFVAGEVGLIAALILRRLARLERRLAAGWAPNAAPNAAPSEPPVSAPVPAPPPPSGPAAPESDSEPAGRGRLAGARHHFTWLLDGNQMSVFLPILVGAGVLASLLAWLVESIARLTTRHRAGRVSRSPEPLAWPAGGLTAEPMAADRSGPRPRRHLLPVASVAGLVVLATSIGALADATQTRPEPRRSGVTTTFVLQLKGWRSADSLRAGQLLWAACENAFLGWMPAAEMTDLGGGRVAVTVGRNFGRSAQAKLRGCLEDAAVDHLQAVVVAVDETAAPSEADAGE